MIRVGIGGWTFAPWRGVFYPRGLPHAEELEYASSRLTSIEINGTFYSLPKPASVRTWASETPDNFVFSVKASMAAVGKKVLAEAGPAIDRFIDSGILELGPKLGPLFWQFPPAKKFNPEDVAAFFSMLPKERNGTRLRHAVEAKNPTFAVPEFFALAAKHGLAVVGVDSEKTGVPSDVTGDFVYLRLQKTALDQPTGYKPAEIKKWAARAQSWQLGEAPKDLKPIGDKTSAKKKRDVFVYFISGAKERAPAAAMALIKQLNPD
ncbi:MAG: DUF72 domain-containing protein [Alphaproteobacteria bacterium]|nr:DUF72 domain-containing protein [Alphaproteobacteria bacterium]